MYQRVVVLGGQATALSVRQTRSSDAPRLVVMTTPPPRTTADRRRLRSLIDRRLGTGINLDGWYRIARQDPRLGVLHRPSPPRWNTGCGSGQSYIVMGSTVGAVLRRAPCYVLTVPSPAIGGDVAYTSAAAVTTEDGLMPSLACR
jgi:hypothetical protein